MTSQSFQQTPYERVSKTTVWFRLEKLKPLDPDCSKNQRTKTPARILTGWITWQLKVLARTRSKRNSHEGQHTSSSGILPRWLKSKQNQILPRALTCVQVGKSQFWLRHFGGSRTLEEQHQEQKLGTSTERRQELDWVEHNSRTKIVGQERTREKEQRKSKRRAWSAENTDRTTNASRNDQGTLLRWEESEQSAGALAWAEIKRTGQQTPGGRTWNSGRRATRAGNKILDRVEQEQKGQDFDWSETDSISLFRSRD
jgi:hypothetical protein